MPFQIGSGHGWRWHQGVCGQTSIPGKGADGYREVRVHNSAMDQCP
jgi:hypothetical protein